MINFGTVNVNTPINKARIGQIYNHLQFQVCIPCMGDVLSYRVFRSFCPKSVKLSKKQTQEKLHINEKRETKTNYSTFPSFSQVVVKKCSGIEEFPKIW